MSEREYIEGGYSPARAPVDGMLRAIEERMICRAELGDALESPIEELLGVEILLAFREYGYRVTVGAGDDYVLVPQYRWGGIYRSDFAILRGGKILLIEADGQEFHSTLAQLAHDDRKDRAAASHGMQTIRFRGSEIYADAGMCARSVVTIATLE